MNFLGFAPILLAGSLVAFKDDLALKNASPVPTML